MIAIGAGIVIALAAGGAGQLSERWEDFQSAEGVDPERESRGTQLLDVSARGRYQYWQSAIDAYETEPLVGLGPGTFEFWWAREGDPEAAIFVRDAHSLYLEVLAELGLVGFLLLVAFMVVVLVQGALRSYRSPPAERAPLAAAVAASFAFAVAAAVEWIWELGALPAIFLLLAAIVVGEVDTPEAGVKDRPTRRPWSRVAGIALPVAFSVIALIAMAIPFAAASFVDASREAAVEGRLDDALSEARHAVAIEPFAATPRMQEAAVLERLGQTSKAVEAARAATEKEPTNWRTWVVLSRLEALNGNPEGSAEAFERARSLFPRLIGT